MPLEPRRTEVVWNARVGNDETVLVIADDDTTMDDDGSYRWYFVVQNAVAP